ncbi:MAG: serine hydrolase [Ilumatobacteraceae bacterium]
MSEPSHQSAIDRSALDAALAAIAALEGDGGVSLATLVVHQGEIVAEQYGPDVDADTTLISWSMAKSITQALIGILVGDGLLDIDAPAAVPEFAGTDKAAITVRTLLAMRSGLEFVEDYVDDSVSHCLEMLFGSGIDDHAHYAASLALIHPPDTVWNYSSGTTNILSRLAGEIISAHADDATPDIASFLADRLFGPLGMTSATPKFDAAGTFVGSSYVYATARDFARFGALYLHDGECDGQRLLPEGWVDYSRAVASVDDNPPHFGYGSHWWIWPDFDGSVAAHGYEGQYIIVVPDRDLVVVQLSKVPTDVRPPLVDQLRRIVAAFPSGRAG